MKRKVSYKYLLSIGILMALLIGVKSLYASSITDTGTELKKIYQELKDIQIQLSSTVENVYANKINNQSNTDSVKILSFGISQLENIISMLEKERQNNKADKIISAKIQSLLGSAEMLRYMGEALKDYVSATSVTEQLQLLKIYFELDGVVKQFLIDFQYFESNPTELS